MRKSWLLCLLVGTLAWGQAQPAAAPSSQSSPAAKPMQDRDDKDDKDKDKDKDEAKPAEVPANAVVLTIKGVCAPAARPAAAKTADGKPATAAKKPADCKTEITRAQFEKIASGLSPNVTPQLKRQLEQALPRFMAMSEIAKKKGLDKSPGYVEKLRIAKMQILTTELQRQVQEEADKVTPAEVDKYYKEHQDGYQQFSLDRLFIPRYKQISAEEKAADKEKDGGNLTEDQQKAKEAEEKAKQEKGEQELNQLAESLQKRAAAGEDFAKLQKEAFEASGSKVDNPTVNLPKVRRTGLPPAHAAVFDLKTGEVSQVITDNGGHYVYKVVSEEVLPLDQVKEEIHNKLKSERQKELMDKYTASFQAVPNETYFGPPAPQGPPQRGMMRPPMSRPPGGPPQGGPQQGAPPQGAPQPPAAPPSPQN